MKKAEIKVMIVEEGDVRAEYRRLMKEHPILRLTAECEAEDEAVELLKNTTVDVLILGLEIGGGSGLLLLERIRGMNIQKPFVVVVTSIISKRLYEPLRIMGADYICSKSATDYSLDIPLTIIELCGPYRKESGEGEVPNEERHRHSLTGVYQKRIRCELEAIGFPRCVHGTSYLEEGIFYLVMSGRTSVSTTKELYPYIAEKFATNTGNVERNIRGVIEKVWTTQNMEQVCRNYDGEWKTDTGRPTNTKFMKWMAEKVIGKYKW